MLRVGLVGRRDVAMHDEWLARVPGLEATASTDVDEAIATADIVAVTEEAAHHGDVLIAALEAGRIVFCRPPLTHDVGHSEALLRLAQARGVEHFAYFPWRLHPALAAAREAVAHGRLGTLRVVDVTLLDDCLAGPGLRGTSWYRTPRAEPGVALVPGIHLADLLRWLPAQEWVPDVMWARAVLGTSGTACGDDAPEDVAAVHLHSADGGAHGRLLMSRAGVGRRTLEVLLLGDRGTLRIVIQLAGGGAAWRLSSGGGEEHRHLPAADPNPYPDVASALSGRPTAAAAATFVDAVAAQRLVTRVPAPAPGTAADPPPNHH